jgi:thiamine kinase-like enzyme
MSKLLDTTKHLLEEQFHTAIEFGESAELDSQFTVLRLPLIADGLPDSIIIKQIPEDARFGASNRLLSEWAALEFMNHLEGEFAPRLILGNLDSLILITEDLGAVPSLQDILSEGQADQAHAHLIAYGRFLGQLQAASFGREEEFRAIQSRLGAETPPNDSSLDLRPLKEAMSRSFAQAKWNDSEKLIEEALHLSNAMHDDSPLRVFTHHDAGPNNILLTGQGTRFVDFEFSRYEHALLDMTALRLAFPPFSHGRRIPQETVLAYEKAYRESAVQKMPSLLDDSIYSKALELASAKWLLTKIVGAGDLFYPLIVCNDWSYATPDAKPERLVYNRRMNYTWLWTYLESFPNAQYLPATYRFLSTIAETMRRHNPELEPFEYYKAFL